MSKPAWNVDLAWNDYVNQTNIAPETIFSKRLIKDYILANRITADILDITRDDQSIHQIAHAICPTCRGGKEEKRSQ